MSYINPIDGLFEARRLQIQQSILNLEERLLKRKQLDLLIEKQTLESQNLQKGRKDNGAYQRKNRRHELEIQLDDRLKYLQNFDSREGLIRALQQQKTDTGYLERLKALEIQQNMIDLQNVRMKEKQFYYKNSLGLGDNLQPLDLSGEILTKKYSDGTRALELNEKLKKSADNLRRLTDRNPVFSKKELILEQRNRLLSNRKQGDHSTVKKYLLSEQKSQYNNESVSKQVTNSNSNGNIIIPTPIKMIESLSSGFNSIGRELNYSRDKIQQINNLQKVDEQQESLQQESLILKSKGLKRSKSKSTQPTNPHIPASYLQPQQLFQTNRLTSKNSRCLSSRQRSLSTLHYTSGIKQSKPQHYQSIKQKILKQVYDRERLSQQSKQMLDIFYAKDITEYLMTIYGKQDKFRKQLKEKIFKIPIVKRKFGVSSGLQS